MMIKWINKNKREKDGGEGVTKKISESIVRTGIACKREERRGQKKRKNRNKSKKET